MTVHNENSRGAGRRIFWRSLEHKANREQFANEASGSDVVKRTIDPSDLLRLNRRRFLTLSGAMGTLAGVEGCIRRPAEKILPYTSQPEYASPGVPLHYTTVTERRGEAQGLLVTSRDGLPTKIEGNPAHPATGGGATDMYAQASILDLYDPERIQAPSFGGVKKGWDAVDALLMGMSAGKGEGLAVLMEPSNSPTVLRVRADVMRKLPDARFYTYSSLGRIASRAGSALAFGKPVETLRDFSKARVVVALDADFMLTEPGAVAAAAGFAAARDMEDAKGEMNRLYVVEPTMSVTGSNADHRLRLAAQDVGVYAVALAAALTKAGLSVGNMGNLAAVSPEGVDPDRWARWTTAVAKDLLANKGKCLLVAGERQPAAVHALVHALNSALGNVGSTVHYRDVVDPLEPDQLSSILTLTKDLNAGAIRTLLILGGNPVYDAPGDLNFGAAVAKAHTTVHFSGHLNETGSACAWQIPRAHELEAWGDQLATDGTYSVQQPLVAPLWYGRSDLEVLSALNGELKPDALAMVSATAQERGHNGEYAWRKLLHEGLEVSKAQPVEVSVDGGAVAQASKALRPTAGLSPENLEVTFQPDNKLLDGRYANNSWLLELPDPITRITWDNVALIAPSTAEKLGITDGDLIRVTLGDAAVEIAAFRQPGQAPHSVSLSMGWGRKVVGSGGYGYASDAQDLPRRGFDVNPLRYASGFGFATGARLEKVGTKYALSQTQEHDFMRDTAKEDEDRPLAVDATLEEYRETPNFTQFASPDPSVGPLWETVDYSKGNQWGMVVDLNLCNGCNACVVACQAENNVPCVGKDQVARGREMHWFRIDRYYVGEDADEPEVAYQPIGCQHCEEAPCENVCPVAATAHSDEGLNDIAYNRCIGTRYCMNNCPYKVRRFNFLNFNEDIPETLKMQRNTQVTNRFRGVIEKCSYCVQRIQNSKIAARREGRELKDGEVVSACMQACATGAITFGDINDPESKVSKKRAVDRNYALLSEIGTRPRTRFLGKIRNPNPEMQA